MTLRRLSYGVVLALALLTFGGGAKAQLDVKKADASVMRVIATFKLEFTLANGKRKSGTLGGTGTGFVINDAGVVITNKHVVQSEESELLHAVKEIDGVKTKSVRILNIQIKVLEPGGDREYPARVLHRDAGRDVAVLETQGFSAPTLLLSVVEPAKGLSVHSLGYPGLGDRLAKAAGQKFSTQSSLGSGIIEKAERGKRSSNEPNVLWVQHSANIRKGNSGGPLFNDCGEVVGINTWGVSPPGAQALLYASHVSELVEVLKQLGISHSTANKVCKAPTKTIVKEKTVIEKRTEVIKPKLLTPVNIAAGVVSLLALIVALMNRSAIKNAAGQAGKRISQLVGTPGPVSPPPPPPPSPAPRWSLNGSDGRGRRVELEFGDADFDQAHGNLVLGQDGNIADLAVADDTVSGQHVRLIRSGSGLTIEDLNSSNGTQVGGRQLKPFRPEPLPPSAELVLGETRLKLRHNG